MDAAVDLERAPVLVMGVGNILCSDDGFADAVLRELEQAELPEWVELFDAGTSAIDLLDVFADRPKLIVLDAVRGGQEPGTLYRFSPDQVEDGALPMNSLHQVGLLETLKLGELINCKPRQTVVIGVQPASTRLGIGLCEEVRRAIPKAVGLALKEIELYAESIDSKGESDGSQPS